MASKSYKKEVETPIERIRAKAALHAKKATDRSKLQAQAAIDGPCIGDGEELSAIERIRARAAVDYKSLRSKSVGTPNDRLLAASQASGSAKAIQDALDEGADPKARFSMGADALAYALRSGSASQIKALAKVCDLFSRDDKGAQALERAGNGKPLRLAALIEAYKQRQDTPGGPSAWERVVGRFSGQALCEAVKYCNVENVKILLEAGADALAPSREGRCAAVLALECCSAGGPAGMKVASMVAKGLDPAKIQWAGRSALMLAAQHGHMELCRFWADTKEALRVDSEGMSALMIAAHSKSSLCIQALLPLSDRDAVDSKGRDALEYALQEPIDALSMASLARGPGAWRLDCAGRTPLEILAWNGLGWAPRMGPGRHWHCRCRGMVQTYCSWWNGAKLSRWPRRPGMPSLYPRCRRWWPPSRRRSSCRSHRLARALSPARGQGSKKARGC